MRSGHAPAQEETEPRAPRASEFAKIRRLAYEKFGLDLKHGKEELVAARLRRMSSRSLVIMAMSLAMIAPTSSVVTCGDFRALMTSR